MNSRWLLGLLLVIFCGALALRASRLDLRPMHGDEAVHAVKFNTLWSQGEYRYDPTEYHGPILYYLALPLVKLAGVQSFPDVTATMLRLVPAGLGALTLGWLWFLRDGFGKSRDAVLWAALFMALSPCLVFYSRYFIQETPLVFFSLGFLTCLWRARQAYKSSARRSWILGAGINAGLMLASKETAIISLTVTLLAWFSTFSASDQTLKLKVKNWLLIGLVAVFVSAALLSNLGRSMPDLHNIGQAASTYFSRSGGQEAQGQLHLHPGYQYFEWLFWYRNGAGPRWTEIFIGAFAAIGLYAALRKSQAEPLPRFLALYTLGLTAAYCAIPYKTPWCVLGFWQGAIILGGYGVSLCWSFINERLTKRPVILWPARGGLILLVATGSWNLWQQDRLANERFFADRRNPWVYAHPTRDVFRLGERVHQLADLSGQKGALPMAVISPGMDYWPLPWELRAQTQVGYFDAVKLGQAKRLPLLIAAKPSLSQLQTELGPEFERLYHVEYYGLRPGVVFGLCIQKPLWEKFISSR